MTRFFVLVVAAALSLAAGKKTKPGRGRGFVLPPKDFDYNQSFMEKFSMPAQGGLRGLSDLPDHLDLREKNLITPVKNQGQCGSCWAFATTGLMEGLIAKETGVTIELSEQQLVSCESEASCAQGGNTLEAVTNLRKSKSPLCPAESYPYSQETRDEEKDGECEMNDEKQAQCIADASGEVMWRGHATVNYTSLMESFDIVKVSDFQGEKPATDEAIMRALNQVGPLAVSLRAAMWSELDDGFTGVLTHEECMGGSDEAKHSGHAVLLVGYGIDEESELPYWLIKNSWGTEFGDNGYIRIERPSKEDAPEGGCLINSRVFGVRATA